MAPAPIVDVLEHVVRLPGRRPARCLSSRSLDQLHPAGRVLVARRVATPL